MSLKCSSLSNLFHLKTAAVMSPGSTVQRHFHFSPSQVRLACHTMITWLSLEKPSIASAKYSTYLPETWPTARKTQLICPQFCSYSLIIHCQALTLLFFFEPTAVVEETGFPCCGIWSKVTHCDPLTSKGASSNAFSNQSKYKAILRFTQSNPLSSKNTYNIFRLALRSFLLFSPLFSSVLQHKKLNAVFSIWFYYKYLKQRCWSRMAEQLSPTNPSIKIWKKSFLLSFLA